MTNPQELFGQINHDPPMPITITKSNEDIEAAVIGRWIHVEPGLTTRGPYDTRHLFVRLDDASVAMIDARTPTLDGENVTLSNFDYPPQ